MSPAIVIPAYNEASVIAQVVRSVIDAGYPDVFVVDDGSDDDTALQAGEAGAEVFRHRLNRGKGAAATTGIEAALRAEASIIVTMDGDGQHDAGDIAKLVAPIWQGTHDVVFGIRPLNDANMPRSRAAFNRIGNIITGLSSGVFLADSQSGFRAFSRKAATMIETNADHYEYETEVIREIARHKLRFTEVPITVRYTHHSRTKGHGQGLVNGVHTVYRMFWNRLSL